MREMREIKELEGKRVSEIISIIVGQYYSSSMHECVVHNAIQCSATG